MPACVRVCVRMRTSKQHIVLCNMGSSCVRAHAYSNQTAVAVALPAPCARYALRGLSRPSAAPLPSHPQITRSARVRNGYAVLALWVHARMSDGAPTHVCRHQRAAGCYAGESTLDGLLNCAVDIAQGIANRSNATGEALTVRQNSGCGFFVRREKSRRGLVLSPRSISSRTRRSCARSSSRNCVPSR